MADLDALRTALACSPDNAPLLMLYAEACLAELQTDEARRAFDRVASLDVGHVGAQLGIARCLHLEGDISGAVVRTEAILSQHPSEAGAWLLLSRLAMAEGQEKEAAAHYWKAVGLDKGLRDESIEKDLKSPPPAPEREEPERVRVFSSGGDADRDMDALTELERPRLSFRDVGGMTAVKEEIRMKIIHPLKNAELFRAYGKAAGGGVLLYGPPGCGKTLLARATAGEIDANFMAIGIHQILDMYLGNSERNLHALFELAREHAPAVLFFDEVDALAADRRDLKQSAGRTLINQFLAEMDGSVSSNENVLIIAATNAPWHIDPAFRRPGRFDRILFVPPPDEEAREAIIGVLAQSKPVTGLDARALAKRTKDFSGADLKAVFDVATEKCLARAMREGRVVPIGMGDLTDAAKGLKPTTRSWFESAKNYAIYANQGGFYDDVLEFLGIRR